MPELPEVETIVRDLKKEILGRVFFDVWTDFEKMVKKPKSFNEFKKELKNKKILDIKRRGKNILIHSSQDKIILIHQKLTGHLLLGYWILDNGYWIPKTRGPLQEKINTYIHLLFTLDNGKMLALSDVRKFAKVELWDRRKLLESPEFKSLGPEPLDEDFTFEKFEEALRRVQGKPFQRTQGKLRKGKIKQVLMDQNIIAGIGNIYSDEILWEAKVNPFKEIKRLSDGEIEKIYLAMKKILKLAIKMKGESISDFRTIYGEKGNFDSMRKIYRRSGEKCFRCGTIIERRKIGGRSTHFCPNCQTP